MRLSIALFLLFSVFAFCADAQKLTSGEKETDRDLRELTGRVHYVEIRRELLESADGKGFEGGWISSSTAFNAAGFLQQFMAYDDDGEFDYQTVSQFDSAGNKVQELTFDKNNNFRGRHDMSYDSDGNMIELKAYDNFDKSMSMWVKQRYNSQGYVVSSTYLSRDGKVLSVSKNTYNRDGKIRETFSFDENEHLHSREKYVYHQKNEELWVAENQGNFSINSVKLIDKNGNITEITYDRNGKPHFEEICAYQRDTQGNWIKEKCKEWESENGILVYKRTKLTERAITYY